MPEGDTIHRTAERLRQVLRGKRIRAARCVTLGPRIDSLVGHTVEAVESRGKHLLIHFDDGRAVHTHLGMTGSWHVYQSGERWRKPERYGALVFECESFECVCFSPKTLELLSSDALRRHDHLRRLGPDLLSGSVDNQEVLHRFRVHNGRAIGEALMNQSIVSGIGNVYKSEILFLNRVQPFATVASLTDQQILDLVARASELMARNTSGHRRRTRFGRDGGRLWVYGRNGEPCYLCGESIRIRRQGDLGRTTYWCPSCQKEYNPK